MKPFYAAALALALAAIALPAPAQADIGRKDIESWNWFEARVPVSDGQHGLPHTLRLWTDARLGTRYPGLGQLFFRVGPVWELHPNWFVATHLTTYADQVSTGTFEQENRLELEPNWRARFGDWTVADRNRLEYRFGRPAGPRWRYRNLFRVNWQPAGATLFPYVWNEALVDLSGLGFNQSRSAIGLSRVLSDSTRLDLAYMLRMRAIPSGAWEADHVVNVYLLFQPKAAPWFPEVADGGSD